MTSSSDIGLNPSELAEFYAKYFRYYNTLEASFQKLFLERCLKFIAEKEISGAGDFMPDNRVKALIAASAVQLTLGLTTWRLDYFETIELHASDFGSSDGQLKFTGETNLSGYIKLSWKSFLNGYKVPDDNINLGLHEFSHALRFNSIRGNEQDYFVENYFNKWLSCAYDAFDDLRQNNPSIFRSYGGANINEFLSVCIEHYFESPASIFEKYPLLYYATGILLNQLPGAQHTKIGIRESFFEAQNGSLPGIAKETLQSSFLRHWSFKLWLFVLALLAYNISTSGIRHPVTFALFFMPVAIGLWYMYSTAKISFDGKRVRLAKGTLLFKDRKTVELRLAQLISLKPAEEEWKFTYYHRDSFFYEEKVTPPKGVKDAFLAACRQNKIAILS